MLLHIIKKLLPFPENDFIINEGQRPKMWITGSFYENNPLAGVFYRSE
jgi:hypothetical protein